MSDLYDEGCNTCRDLAVDSSFSFDESVIADALKRIYETDFNPMSEIEENLFRETWKTFNNAVDKGVSLSTVTPASDFITQLKTNNAVFAAFRTHRMQNDIAAKLLDDKGNLKSFSQFAKDVLPITNHHVKSWLRTEYDTAVIRAHQAADWKQYEAEKDVLPNLEWLPSTSIVPGEDHRIFWGVVYPVNAAFWNRHKPGDRWNCKCRLQATDKATNVAHKYGRDLKYAPALGLDNNPAKDAMIFSKSHPFYTKTYPGAKKAVDNFLKKQDILKLVKSVKNNAIQREIPPNIETYIDKYKGKVFSSPWHGKEELKDNLRVAKTVSKKTNEIVYLLPRLDPKNAKQVALRKTLLPKGVPEGKNTDFLIGGKLFECKSIHVIKNMNREGIKESIENHIKNAKKQADNIILEITSKVSRKEFHPVIKNYLSRTKKDREIWILHKNKLYKYKKTPITRG